MFSASKRYAELCNMMMDCTTRLYRLIYRIGFTVCLTGSAYFGMAQNAHHPKVQPKLSEGKFVQDEFYINQQDTIYKSYERVAYSVEQGDTILQVEKYHLNRIWTLNRYIISGSESVKIGWQQEFDQHGFLITEQFCDTSSGSCTRRKQYHYYPNGNALAILQYNKQKLEGVSTFYYNSGSLKYTLDYRNNRIWNILDYYDQAGNTLNKGDFADGNGVMHVYAANGVLLKKKIYRNGRVIKVCSCSGDPACPCIK